MLNKIKLLIGITDNSKDELLLTLIDQATNELITFTHNPKCVPIMENTIIEMAIYKYNRLGSEGLASEGYSGVSFSYTTDYPESILRSLRNHRKAIFK